MKREVHITIRSVQKDEDNEEVIESAAFGEFSVVGHTYVLRYDELSEEGDVTKTLIKLSDKGIEVVKRGNTNSKMKFLGGEVTESDYETIYGTLQMAIQTYSAGFEMTEDNVIAEVDYLLYLNGQLVSRNFLQIEAKFK